MVSNSQHKKTRNTTSSFISPERCFRFRQSGTSWSNFVKPKTEKVLLRTICYAGRMKKRVEEEYADVLKNIEAAIMAVFDNNPKSRKFGFSVLF